jgi:hypothetical protein
MKHLMRYEGFSSMDRADEILDKISKYGIQSLSKSEKDFLDSYKSGEEESYHNQLSKKEVETTFEDDNRLFRFEFEESEDHGDEIHHIGILYVPPLEWPNGKRIEGRLKGRIIAYSGGQTSPDFSSECGQYDVFEFCNGLEYDLDNFIDYVVGELGKKED